MSEVIVQVELPKQCIDCCVRSECDLYMNELRKPFEKRDFTAFKPLGKGCLIRGVLPEQHGRLVDINRLLKDWTGVWSAYDRVRFANAPTIVPTTERSET